MSGCTSINLYFEDESRFGLLTVLRRMITAKGIKPTAPFLHRFDNLYLFGAFSPITGDSYLLEMPHCNSDTFQLFLDHLSNQNPAEFKILILDNGAFHHGRRLLIPDNIALIFLPPYSPELNPAEKMWRYFKGDAERAAELFEAVGREVAHDLEASFARRLAARPVGAMLR